jgi:hypothetical protein
MRGRVTLDAVVHSDGWRGPGVAHPKLTPHVVDFAALPPLDEVYLALGTTIKAAGSQSAFRAVDFDANLAVARAALATGARRAGLVSAMGADAKSRVFYNRVKGEIEEALAQFPFDGLIIARPSLLTGDREALGQPKRPAERAATAVSRLLGPLSRRTTGPSPRPRSHGHCSRACRRPEGAWCCSPARCKAK